MERLQGRSERAIDAEDASPPCWPRILYLRISFARLIHDGEHAAMLGYLPLHGVGPLLQDLLTQTPHWQVGDTLGSTGLRWVRVEERRPK